VQIAISLAKDENRQQELKTNISKLAVADADVRIATAIINTINS
jgi:hypothetical protein